MKVMSSACPTKNVNNVYNIFLPYKTCEQFSSLGRMKIILNFTCVAK